MQEMHENLFSVFEKTPVNNGASCGRRMYSLLATFLNEPCALSTCGIRNTHQIPKFTQAH